MANAFELFMNTAGKIPAVRISREEFLRNTFRSKISNPVFLDRIIEKGPLEAGVKKERVDKIADSVITSTVSTATGASFIAGMPGGLAMFATIPIDTAQMYTHIFVVIQKLLYLYGWKTDIFDEAGNIDDETKKLIVMSVGLMSGVGAAAKPLAAMAAKSAKHIIDRTILKSVSPKIIAEIIKRIGLKATTKAVFKYTTKAVPVLGGIFSGAITLATFLPMANKLKKYLSDGIIDIDDTDDYLDDTMDVEDTTT